MAPMQPRKMWKVLIISWIVAGIAIAIALAVAGRIVG
jgi:hypothetical protein